MGAFLLAAGAKGKRFSLPNSKVMIHQPLGGAQGQATDIEIHARDILKTGRLNRILAERTGQPLEKIERDTERDYFLDAEKPRPTAWSTRCISKRRLRTCDLGRVQSVEVAAADNGASCNREAPFALFCYH